MAGFWFLFPLVEGWRAGRQRWRNFLELHTHESGLERKGGKVAFFGQQAAWLSGFTCANRFGKVWKGGLKFSLARHTHKSALERKGGKVALFGQ
jgi:hypothetical protein